MRNWTWDREDNRRLLFTADATLGGFFARDTGEVIGVDVVFPVLHGLMGEDGTVQGLCELNRIPFVGCGTLSSAAAMDKAVARRLFEAAGLPLAAWLDIRQYQYEADPAAFHAAVEEKIGYPNFVKPANSGSSIGVSKAKDRAELIEAISAAFKYDGKLLVERAVQGREIELSVLGREDDLFVSVPGEIRPVREFYDYIAKYDDSDSELIVPADLPEKTVQALQDAALRAFTAVDGTGLCRADFFVEDDQVLLNEINTMPGFTNISMYFVLMRASGREPIEVIDKLVQFALDENKVKRSREIKRQ
jgi:D-alanine-D-alanine ligase